jgi:hypothetical protein
MPAPENRGDDRDALLAVAGARIEHVAGPACDLRTRNAAVVSERAGRKAHGMPPSRQELVAALERVARGDRAALGRVYGATALKLYGIVARILRRRDLADDVSQD